MNNTKVKTTVYETDPGVLAFVQPKAAMSVLINGSQVPRDSDGKYRLYAGQALQAPPSIWEDRQTECTLAPNGADAGNVLIGVSQHDIVFMDPTESENGNCIVFGWIDPSKMHEAALPIPEAVRIGLAKRVTYLATGSTGEDPGPANPTISSLTLQGIGLSPAFDPAVTEYTAGTVRSATVLTVTTEEPDATVTATLNNLPVTIGGQIVLAPAINTLRVICRHKGVSQMYTVSIVYTEPDTKLSALSITGVTLNPAFDPDVTEYIGTPTSELVSVTATDRSGSASVLISHNGDVLSPGQTVQLAEGNNIFRVEVSSVDSSTTYTVSVIWSSVSNVSTDAELRTALADERISTINLTADIALTDSAVISRAMLFNGGNHTLTYQETAFKDGIVVEADNVTVQNLTVHMTNDDPLWEGHYGIQVYDSTDVTLQNLISTGEDGGFIINGSTVTMKGTINVSANEFGGVEISKSDSLTNFSSLDVTDTTFENTSEAYAKPTLWIDGDLTQNVVIGDSGQFTRANVNGQIQFYLDPANVVPSVAVTGVTVAPTTVSVVEGATEQLTATVAPANATNPAVTWSSNAEAFATVDANGLVTAVAEGSATITATTTDGQFFATCAVTVTAAG